LTLSSKLKLLPPKFSPSGKQEEEKKLPFSKNGENLQAGLACLGLPRYCKILGLNFIKDILSLKTCQVSNSTNIKRGCKTFG
jgi:hypothetical protein